MMRRSHFYMSLIGVVMLFMLAACSVEPTPQAVELAAAATETPYINPTLTSAVGQVIETPEPTATPLLAEILTTRVPDPTSTPGNVERAVANYTARAGLATTRFLGLKISDWINLILSIVFVSIGYLLGTWIIRRLLPRLVRRTPSEFDDELLTAVGLEIRWFVVILITAFSTDRLTFFGASLKLVLKDIYFVIGLYIAVRFFWKLAELMIVIAQRNADKEGRGEDLAPIFLVINRLGRVLIIAIGLTVLLSNFGINVTALTAALGIGGLAFSLAARDTVADAIAGVILLVDRPFRVGDRIEIQGVGTWGDVIDIGLRTTRIRTRDNRMIIVPNSIISHNQVINYSYPDPRYRIETNVDIPFGTDIETVRSLLIETISKVEGVLLEKPIDALYVDMSGAAMEFRLRWWIESYADTRRMFDRVHTAIQHALDSAGIVSPNVSNNINLQVDQETTTRLSNAFRVQGPGIHYDEESGFDSEGSQGG